jgi:hypothetical protein
LPTPKYLHLATFYRLYRIRYKLRKLGALRQKEPQSHANQEYDNNNLYYLAERRFCELHLSHLSEQV